MCSTDRQRIADIGKAIDDLAAEALADRADALADGSDAEQLVVRLAQLWALLADLNPEVARRLPRYQA
jgi:hypothetical protein